MALAVRRLVLAAALSLAACAAGRPRLGEIRLRPYGNLTASLSSFSVQQGRILSPDLDLTVEEDGCIRGLWRRNPLQLCQTKPPEPSREGAQQVQHWQGLGGDFVVELEENGTRMRADGYLSPGGGASRGFPIQATLPMGKGPHWDELRKHPALLAVAAAMSGVRGEPDSDALETFTR